MTDDHNQTSTDQVRFRGAIDDVIIVPMVSAALVVNKILRFIFSMLMRLLDYAFPFAMQIVWLPLLAIRVIGDVIVTITGGALRLLPMSDARRQQWRMSARRNWSRLRQRISYRAFERVVHDIFEGGMAWVFRTCRHLSPATALLVILGAVLWLPVSFGVATAMHGILFAKIASWPAWTQLLHPLATIVAKSKLLVLPVYPAAWPQAKKHPLVQLMFGAYEAIIHIYAIQKIGFRYRQAETAAIATVERLERTAVLASAMNWLRKVSAAEYATIEKYGGDLDSFFARWSMKFSAEYYEEKERQAAEADKSSRSATG